MIKIQVEAENYDLDADLKKHIEERFGSLDEFMDTLQGGHVTVSWEGGPNEQTCVRAQMWAPGHNFDGSDTDWKAQKAIDSTRHKLETQIRRAHGKELSKRDHKRH